MQRCEWMAWMWLAHETTPCIHNTLVTWCPPPKKSQFAITILIYCYVLEGSLIHLYMCRNVVSNGIQVGLDKCEHDTWQKKRGKNCLGLEHHSGALYDIQVLIMGPTIYKAHIE